MHSHGVIAETDEEAVERAWKYIVPAMNEIGSERDWGPMSRANFESEVESGSYYVGSPETVAKRMAKVIKEMGIERFDLVYGINGQLQEERFQRSEERRVGKESRTRRVRT